MLLDPSNFITKELHSRPVVLADGQSHNLYFREVDAATYSDILVAMRSKDEDVRKTAVARLIACCVCNEDGTPALTEEQAANLKPAVSIALGNVAFEVNPATYAGNASKPGERTGSGTSSPSHSADEPSPSGSA